MQKILIHKRKRLNVRFVREISIDSNKVEVTDNLFLERNAEVTELFRSTDLVNIHVITSDSFQLSNLLSWETLTFDPSKKNLTFVKEY
jgi:hypothetical protein